MLAAAIGALLVSACVGVFAAMESHERRLRAREQQVMGLSRLHTVMRRAFSSLVMSEPMRTTNASGTLGRGAGDAQEQASAAARRAEALQSAVERAKARQDSLRQSLPPRIGLGYDAVAVEYRMVPPADSTHAPGPLQRFELLLTQHPLLTKTWSAPGSEAEMVAAARERARSDGQIARNAAADAQESKKHADERSPDAGAGSAEEAGSADDAGATMPGAGASVRGAFEIRPSVDANGAPVIEDGRVRSWTLYWQPLAPKETSPGSEVVPGVPPSPPPSVPNGPPVEVATDLEYVHWQVFRERERRAEHVGVWTPDLPAYIEMEVKTIDGLWANWMFEIDWVTGAEDEAPAAGSSDGTGESPDEGGDAGAPATPGLPTPKIETLRPAR